jgi:hypothetical protein
MGGFDSGRRGGGPAAGKDGLSCSEQRAVGKPKQQLPIITQPAGKQSSACRSTAGA